MNKQNGIVKNLLNELNNVVKDENEKDNFMKIPTRIICNIIGKKLTFSDDLLNFCWVYNTTMNDNTNTELYNNLIKLCSDIIENSNKKEWYYFKAFILTSNVCG